jgi:hypothetical protein
VVNDIKVMKNLNKLKNKFLKSLFMTDVLDKRMREVDTLCDKVDYMLLTKNAAYDKLIFLIERDVIVICNLSDRDGRIGLPIMDVKNDYERDYCLIYTEDINCKMKDSCLYNLIYIIDKDIYSLEVHDEYFEKINIEND